MVVTMAVSIFCNYDKFVYEFNYKDLITSVEFHVTGSELSQKITFFIGMALLNAIPLQMFQYKMKISQPVLTVSRRTFINC